MNMPDGRVAFYGPRAAGKTTAVDFLKEQFAGRCTVISSAEPLYELQSLAYRLVGLQLHDGEQDATTLAAMATILRRLDPDVLAKHVVKGLSAEREGEGHMLYICPDSRPQDRDYLRANGFTFIHISASQKLRLVRRSTRGDLGEINDDEDPNVFFRGDRTIVNEGPIEDLRSAVLALIEEVVE